jgi:predicted HTH domain antitoxin
LITREHLLFWTHADHRRPADDIAQHTDPGREALERLALEGYRSGALTHHQAGQLLGLSRFEFDDLLIERKIHHHAYSIEDLKQDLADLEKLRAQAC